jgi:hypothetical protein
MRLRFGSGGRNDADKQRAEAIKSGIRRALSLSVETAITVSEIACADPVCPVLETVILIMEPGQKTRAYKLHGALNDLDPEAIRAALDGAAQSA